MLFWSLKLSWFIRCLNTPITTIASSLTEICIWCTYIHLQEAVMFQMTHTEFSTQTYRKLGRISSPNLFTFHSNTAKEHYCSFSKSGSLQTVCSTKNSNHNLMHELKIQLDPSAKRHSLRTRISSTSFRIQGFRWRMWRESRDKGVSREILGAG